MPEPNQTPQVDYILLQITASSAAGLQTLQVYILYAVYRSADSAGLQTLHLTTDDCQFYRSTDPTGLQACRLYPLLRMTASSTASTRNPWVC